MKTRLLMTVPILLGPIIGCKTTSVTGFGLFSDSLPQPTCSPYRGIILTADTRIRGSYASYMMVGDVGGAAMRPVCQNGHIGDPLVNATFRTSDPAVVSVAGATLTALALGRAIITGRVGTSTDSLPVEVVSSEADSLHVTLWRNFSGRDAQYDSSGSLTAVSIAVGESLDLDWQVFLRGWYVWVDRVTVTSADSAIAAVTANCRPREVDPDCSVVSATRWVTGRRAGQTSITVAVPRSDASRSFVVNVL